MLKTILAIVASVILPGAGHLVVGRRLLRGVIAVLVASGLLNVMLAGRLIWPASGFAAVAKWALYGYVVVWAAALADIIDDRIIRRRRAEAAAKDDLARQGMTALVEGDWPAALARFEAVLRIDPYSAHAHFYRAVTLAYLNRRRQARRAFRRCYFNDASGRWRPVVRKHLEEASR